MSTAKVSDSISHVLKFEGSAQFRYRVIASILSGKVLKVDSIRDNDMEDLGLHDEEVNFLRLIEQMSEGLKVEINETGTAYRFQPGMLVGGELEFDCGLNKCIGWYLEAILLIAPFCKETLDLTLTGITNDRYDLNVDTLRGVTIPLLKNFGIKDVEFHINKRGSFPKGGGEVRIVVPFVREIEPFFATDEGKIARIRGTAYGAKVSPTTISRMINSSKEVLSELLSDVHIDADHQKGAKSGASAGYSMSLIAETSTGALLSIQNTASGPYAEAEETPEDIGNMAARLLVEEIVLGGVIDRNHQCFVLMMMVLTPSELNKTRFGHYLMPQAIDVLRLIKTAFNVTFNVRRDKSPNDQGEDEQKHTILLSCVGTNFKNMARKIVY